MSNEWRDLPTMADVAAAQAAGDEIEVYISVGNWYEWDGELWHSFLKYRARPHQPKMKKVKSLCFRHKEHGTLAWSNKDIPESIWQRFPAGDIEGEVEE